MPATVIVGAQWGDEGKGKIVDLLAQDSDIVCRYQGGPNAGHTIVVGEDTFKIRALPSGIVRGKPCVIGNGCVVDPEVLLGELDDFEQRGHSTSEVYLSGNAHLIMPWHLAIDQASERRLGKLAMPRLVVPRSDCFTPVPAVSFPGVTRGGQAAAHAPLQALLVPLSARNR